MEAHVTRKGFTLIELLIVIGIIAILAAVVLLTLNPAELLRQARDSNRVSDFDSLRSGLALYLADVSNPDMGDHANCYVITIAGFNTIDAGCDGDGTAGTNPARFVGGVTTQDPDRNVDGTGWVPVNLTAISSGSPLPNLPVDPTNNTTYYYAFRPGSIGCTTSCTDYEVNADMESAKFITREGQDGGNSGALYEVGTDQALDL